MIKKLKENIKNIFNKKQYNFKVDIHCHTSRYSGCSIQSPEETVEIAIERDIDCIIFTEHFLMWEKTELELLQEKYPHILILNGIEYSARFHDILIYGIDSDLNIPDSNKMDEDMEKLLMRKNGKIMKNIFGRIPNSLTVEEVLDYFEPFNCAFVLAHPFRFSNNIRLTDDTIKRFQAIECDSCNFKPEDRELSIALAKKIGLPFTYASDSHSTEYTGKWYIETPKFNTINEFVSIIRNGDWKTPD